MDTPFHDFRLDYVSLICEFGEFSHVLLLL